jgi:AraC-like DNA-binding protein
VPDPFDVRRSERVLPTASAQVLVSAGQTGAIYVGPRSRCADIELNVDAMMTGAEFAVGAVTPFVRVAADQTADRTIPLDQIWSITNLADELAELSAHESMDRLENELLKQLRSALVNHAILTSAASIRSGVEAGRVGAALGLDRRTFVPEFKRIVGIGPKHYERVHRFGRAIDAIRQQHPGSLAAIAADLGFADQAHLTREVVHFAGGITPGVLLGDGSSSPTHVDHDRIFKT